MHKNKVNSEQMYSTPVIKQVLFHLLTDDSKQEKKALVQG